MWTYRVATRADYQGRRVWITGGSSGIGAALAAELLTRGAAVAVSADHEPALRAVAGDKMTVVPVDVTNAVAMRAAAATVREQLGGLDIVVLNAGIWRPLRLEDVDTAAFAEQLDVNVMGVVNGIAAVFPGFLETGSGAIVIMGSISGYRGLPGSMAYSASKAALNNLAESIRAQAARLGVRVVIVNPGFVRTPLTDPIRVKLPFLVSADDAARRIADGLLGRRQEIAFPLPVVVILKLIRMLPLRAWTWLTGRIR